MCSPLEMSLEFGATLHPGMERGTGNTRHPRDGCPSLAQLCNSWVSIAQFCKLQEFWEFLTGCRWRCRDSRLWVCGQRKVCAWEGVGGTPWTPSPGKTNLWKAAATANTRERESYIHFLAVDNLELEGGCGLLFILHRPLGKRNLRMPTDNW